MAKHGLRRAIHPNGVLGGHAHFRKQQIQKLCARLGVTFTDVPDLETEMWAEIGEFLALYQPEFMRPKKRGRARNPKKREMELALLAEQELARAGGTKKEALKRLRDQGIGRITSIETAASQASRGCEPLHRARYYGDGEDEYTMFDVDRAEFIARDQPTSC